MKRTTTAPKKKQSRKHRLWARKTDQDDAASGKQPVLMKEQDLDHLGEIHDEEVHPERH